MKTRNLVTWLSPLALALLAFGSQIAFAQDASTARRDDVRAEALQAQQSGTLERQRVTSYSPNTNWGPGAPANTSARARAQAIVTRPDASAPPATAAKTPTGRKPV